MGLCAGSRLPSLSPLSPGSWPSTAWVRDLHPSCTDTRRASSLYRSRADLEPFTLDGSLENAERWPASVRRIGSEPQSAGPKGSFARFLSARNLGTFLLARPRPAVINSTFDVLCCPTYRTRRTRA